jgi:hypothetical protein
MGIGFELTNARTLPDHEIAIAESRLAVDALDPRHGVAADRPAVGRRLFRGAPIWRCEIGVEVGESSQVGTLGFVPNARLEPRTVYTSIPVTRLHAA